MAKALGGLDLPVNESQGGTNATTFNSARTNMGLNPLIAEKTLTYLVVAGDRAKLIHYTGAGGVDLTLTAAATLGDGFNFILRNDAAADITINPNGGELINGAATLAVAPGNAVTVYCDAIGFYTSGIATTGGFVTSVSGTAGRITSSGGATPVIDIDATYVGQASITTLGTVATGTWNASLIPLAYGGTNANLTASNGGIFYSTATAGAILAGTATAAQMLQSGATAAPVWSTATWPATTTINQILYSSAANTVAGLATANSASLVTTSAGVPVMTASMTDGQIVIGVTGGTPVAASLTPGANITITPGAGTLEIAASAGSGEGAKFWIKANGAGTTINDSFNVTSITDTGTGKLTITIGTDFSSADYAALGSVAVTQAAPNLKVSFFETGTQAAGSIEIDCVNENGANVDPNESYFCAGFGDQ